jgi:nitrile hydratase beta subunit
MSNTNYISHADLGGQSGFGPVVPEPEGEYFHAAWEPRALALTLAMGATGCWNIDRSRSARETIPNYLSLSYYAMWLTALEKLLEEHGLVLPDEFAAGRALHPAQAVPRVLQVAHVPRVLATGSPTERPSTTRPRFAVGQVVRTYAGEVPHHTRLPDYVRGKCGVIERLHGTHVFADANAMGRPDNGQWLYTVVFDGADLWGDPSSDVKVSVDAWEPYLEAV